MKKKLLIITIVFFIKSCISPSDEPILIIKNKSEITIDSIVTYTSINLLTTFYSLSPNEKIEGKILFDKRNKDDGCYNMIIYNKGSILRKKCFGYYTNGGSLHRRFTITIEKDTIKINSI